MIRKVYNLIPKIIRERIKLIYYNKRIKNYYFSIKEGRYWTKATEGWSISTLSPLYFIVKDIQRYERFYKVAEGNIVIDAGANEGVLSLIYSKKVKKSGKVFSFEPDSINLKRFRANVKLNENVSNIYVLEKALWNITDEIYFYEAGNVASSVFPGKEKMKQKSISSITIDDFVHSRNIEKLDFVKMDIEGAEIEALKGAVNSLAKFRPHLAIASYHFVEGEYTYKALETFFKKINYPFKTVFYEDGEIITYAGINFQQQIEF